MYIHIYTSKYHVVHEKYIKYFCQFFNHENKFEHSLKKYWKPTTIPYDAKLIRISCLTSSLFYSYSLLCFVPITFLSILIAS